MRFQYSLLQIIGFFLLYAALGYLIPVTDISLNPFAVAPFWIVTLALSVALIGLVLGLLGGRFTPKFKLTRLQWVGIDVLLLALFMSTYLFSTHGTRLLGALPMVVVVIVVFGMQILSRRPQRSE